jgi:hypothetical protein
MEERNVSRMPRSTVQDLTFGLLKAYYSIVEVYRLLAALRRGSNPAYENEWLHRQTSNEAGADNGFV